MRIISGKFKGRKFVDSSHLKYLRPTTDRTREALFNILFSSKNLRDLNFSFNNILDLCCGTGAVAFESLSRGANYALLIEKNSKHLEIAKENAKKFGITNEAEFLLGDATNLPQAKMVFDFVYIDPPYKIAVSKMVDELIEKKYVDENSLIAIESEKKSEEKFERLKLLDLREFGIAKIGFYMVV